jgi:hypothetical protein
VISYPLHVSTTPDFADILSRSIDRWYDSFEDFARQATKVAGKKIWASNVSRWCSRTNTPSISMIQLIAPLVLDDNRQPIAMQELINSAYPGINAPGTPGASKVARVRTVHPLALEIDGLIGDNSMLNEEARDRLESLFETIVAPYRTNMPVRKRR